jgi:ABC-2 type transport system permease protein
MASWLSVLSPTMMTQGVLLDVAATSTFRYDHFRAETSAFQQQWRSYFEPRVLDAATLTPAEYAAAPAFAYDDEPPAAMIRRVMLPLAAMTALAMALWWRGFRSYLGYPL